MTRFILAPDAADDLEAIWDYVAADSVRAADRLLEPQQMPAESLFIARQPKVCDICNAKQGGVLRDKRTPCFFRRP